MKILGIETSCDETAAAVVEDGTKILSSSVFSQIELHRPYGGVVPGIAAQSHCEEIIPVVDTALREAKLSFVEIDTFAVATTPGLQIALLVGTETAKAFSYSLDKPLVAVNDLESHVFANFLDQDLGVLAGDIWPLLALVVSGGTTALLLFPRSFGDFKIIGATLDDTAGEAFDKVARLLDLGYPGGPEIEKISGKGKSDAFSLPRPLLFRDDFNFSFSGLKTAVWRIVRDSQLDYRRKEDLAASFQQAVVDVLVGKTLAAARHFKAKSVAVGGGVAANNLLRQELQAKSFCPLFFPEKKFCTDNAAMVAGCAFFYAQKGIYTPWEELEAFQYKNLKGEVCRY